MKQKLFFLGIGMSILFSVVLSLCFTQSSFDKLKLYTYQVGIYNEKQNALDMINSLSNYDIVGLSYVKDNQYYVVACLTIDKSYLDNIINKLDSIGINGIEKNYLVESKYRQDIEKSEFESVLEVIANYDS